MSWLAAYERGHQRPALTVYTFHAPEGCQSQPSSPTPQPTPHSTPRPPIPQRCSSLERPSVPAKSGLALYSEPAEQNPDTNSMQPMYVNMHELASMAASKAQEMAFPPPPPELTTSTEPHPEKTEGQEKDGSTSESSLESSSGYGSQTMPGTVDDNTAHTEGNILHNFICMLCVCSII
ncbi:hypothetical protein J6590_044787 [Homalodisca vitripennis]|nr:hypothetical protein J6590_044787 [Homalodisca vitripennis]